MAFVARNKKIVKEKGQAPDELEESVAQVGLQAPPICCCAGGRSTGRYAQPARTAPPCSCARRAPCTALQRQLAVSLLERQPGGGVGLKDLLRPHPLP